MPLTEQELRENFKAVCIYYCYVQTNGSIFPMWYPGNIYMDNICTFDNEYNIIDWYVDGVVAPTKDQLMDYNLNDIKQIILVNRIIYNNKIINEPYTFHLTGPWNGNIEYTYFFDKIDNTITMKLPPLQIQGDNITGNVPIETIKGLELLKPTYDWTSELKIIYENSIEKYGIFKFSSTDGKIRIYTGLNNATFSPNDGLNGFAGCTITYKI
jgi:hypothetical protein